MASTERRLQKSRTDRMIDGVCGGIAAYFAIDATLVRIVWVLMTLFGGSGVILYIAAMIIMPKEDSAPAQEPPAEKKKQNDSRFWGVLLVVIGLFWLLGNLGIPVWHHWWGFPWHFAFPLLLILAGVAFLFGGRSYVSAHPVASQSPQTEPGEAARGEAAPFHGEAAPAPGVTAPSSGTTTPAEVRRLYRSITEKKILGVCGGIAAYVNIDPVIVRLLFVVGALATSGFVFIVYLLMGLVIPKEPAPLATT